MSENSEDSEEENNADQEEFIKSEEVPQKRRKRKKRIAYPAEIRANPKIKKYWLRRFSLFSRFDEGIKLDEGRNICFCLCIFNNLN